MSVNGRNVAPFEVRSDWSDLRSVTPFSPWDFKYVEMKIMATMTNSVVRMLPASSNLKEKIRHQNDL